MSALEAKFPATAAPPSLVIATNNPGKIREFIALIGHVATLCPLSEFGLTLPAEIGSTFEENARAKAEFVASATRLPTIADDSGLEVDALNGAPGVRTARFAGSGASDQDNRTALLELLDEVPPEQRTARFVCVIAIADVAGNIVTTSGVCVGSISMQETGSGGFGFDPVFLLQDGRTMAELTDQEKNEISHRGIALREAMPILLTSISGGRLQANSGTGMRNER